MLTRYALILLLSLPAFSQTLDSATVDFSLFGITKPVTMGSTPPDTCEQGQLFFSTSAPAGLNLFSCDAANTWTVVGSGAPAALSAVALSGSFNDLLDKPSIPTNTSQLTNDSGFLGPTSNAFSANKLAANPILCAAGQYATGIVATGNSNCAQVQYSQIGGRPASYTLPQATSTLLGGVMAGTGLSVSSGILAVKYGVVAGTAAQGNDSRILGALQKSTGLADLKLTGASPATISSPTTGKAASAGIADTARSLQGIGPLWIVSMVGAPKTLATGQIGMWLEPADGNLHLKDSANANRSVMVRTWVNGVEKKCDQSKGLSAFIDFSASGIPECSVPLPTPPVGVTVSGSSCTITSISNGVITGASCTP